MLELLPCYHMHVIFLQPCKALANGYLLHKHSCCHLSVYLQESLVPASKIQKTLHTWRILPCT